MAAVSENTPTLEKLDVSDTLVADRVQFVRREPFSIFQVPEYLPPAYYDELRRSFPSVDLCDRSTNGKRMFSWRDDVYADFLQQNPIWRDLVDTLSSWTFVQDAERGFKSCLRRARGLDGWKVWQQGKPGNAVSRKLSLKAEVRFEFSFLGDGAEIEPHTDGGGKLLSLLLYFPDADEQMKDIGGTEFYAVRDQAKAEEWRNFENIPVDKQRAHAFSRDFEILYKAPFVSNVLYGFVKSDMSYHGMRPLNLPPGACRKSLNINVVSA